MVGAKGHSHRPLTACRYELRAVEGALAAAVRSYEAEVTALETRLLPCLHKLLRKVLAPSGMTF